MWTFSNRNPDLGVNRSVTLTDTKDKIRATRTIWAAATSVALFSHFPTVTLDDFREKEPSSNDAFPSLTHLDRGGEKKKRNQVKSLA